MSYARKGGRGADCDGGGDHWEDGTEQASAHLGLELFKFSMEERYFRQKEWH